MSRTRALLATIRRVLRIVSIAALVAVAALLPACAPDRPARPHVVLLTLDTTRLDRVIGTEHAERLAPRITAFARDARTFPRARSVGSLTLPAHASMLTGLYPPRHGARANGPQVLTPAAETLAELARDAGYATGGFVGSLALDRAYGVAQGFEFWSQPEPREGRLVGEITDRRGDVVVHAALSWLDRRDAASDAPVFLWVHLFDPHAPYAPRPGELARADDDAYDGEIVALDDAVGKLLDGLRDRGILDGAYVAIVGDHGESLGEHGEATHGLYGYDATLRVPFVLRDPSGHGAGSRDDALVSVVDVAPTIADAMGIDAPVGADGRSLYRRAAPADRAVYFECLEGWRRYGWSAQFGWVDERGKYLHSTRPEFYDVREDPGELRDAWTPTFDASRYLDAFRELASRPRLEPAPTTPLDAGRVAELRALGYTASEHEADAFPAPGDPLDGPAPADRVAEAQAVEDALAYFAVGRADEAERRFLEILADNPANRTAAERAIELAMARGDYAAAAPLIRDRLALPPETIALHRDLARCCEALGSADEARRHERRALELSIRAHERRGEHAEADRLRRALADAPR